jgi:hypothetical protein
MLYVPCLAQLKIYGVVIYYVFENYTEPSVARQWTVTTYRFDIKSS